MSHGTWEAQNDELNGAQAVDPYEEQPILEEVSLLRGQKLTQDATNFHQRYEEFKKRPFFSDDHYYLISAKWLRRWKLYVSYNEVVASKNCQKFFGCGVLPQINEDIVQSTDSFTIAFESDSTYLNIKLQPGLMQKKDYEFVNDSVWEVFEDYSRIAVKRYVADTSDGKKVELYYQNLTLIPLCPSMLKDIQHERTTKFSEVTMQYSRYASIKQLTDSIDKSLGEWAKKQSLSSYSGSYPRFNQYSLTFPSSNFVKFWIAPEGTRKTILLNTLHQGCKANPSFSYKLYFQGEVVEKEKIIGDLQISDDTVIVAELLQNTQNWVFFNFKNKLEASCSYCKGVKELSFVCSCKYAVYCSKRCKTEDKSQHKYRCPNEAESDEEQQALVLTQNSRRGLAGLRNLGNTCFMNSGLQCLSHIDLLTEYFLSGKYVQDINKTNPLGTKGELSTEYAKMIKKLWLGDEMNFAPTHLKKSIGKFQPMFTGYNQHDSGELITYLLDGLHEDLNRVIQKPYTQIKDYDGRPDHVIAKEAWQVFSKRNQSIIVDLIYGQFRSFVQCPTQSCKNVSITFDPFSVCSLPIKNTSKKQIELTFIKESVFNKKITISYSLDKSPSLQSLLPQLRSIVGVHADKGLLLYVSSYSSCEVIDIKQEAEKIRQEYKYRTLYVRQVYPNQDTLKGIKLMIANVVFNDYYNQDAYRKNIIPYHLFYTSINTTNKQLYHQILGYYSKILKCNQLTQQQFEDKYINVKPEEDTFRLLMIPFSRYYTCTYCQKRDCGGCKLPYNDDLFSNFVKYNPDSEYDRDRRLDIELFWRKDSKQVQKIFEEIKQEQKNTWTEIPQQPKISSNTNIYNCLNLFQQEQVLGEENAWYCPKCKEFVLAKKQMKIYKAPKILILCLKRFKRKDYFSQKINLLIECPVQGLDLTEHVSNPDLPQDYFSTGETQMKDENGKVLYDLIGISNHFGGTGGGHYTAYCKDPTSGDWYDFDDSSVSKLKGEEDVVSDSAYILFYRRR